MRRLAIVATALGALMLTPAAAQATITPSCVAGTMTITITAPPPLDAAVSVAGNVVTINAVAELPCVGLTSIVINAIGNDVNTVSYTGNVAGTVLVNLGGGGDTFTATGAQEVTANGEGGTDTLTGGNGGDTLRGGAAIDSVSGGAGADTIFGEADPGDTLDGGGNAGDLLSYAGESAIVVNLSGSGAPPAGTDNADGFANVLGGDGGDTITGDGAANNLNGGPGTDTVTYLDRAVGVTVTLDGAANDGGAAGAEGDNVIAENVTGGGVADTLTGDNGANVLNGAGGIDTVTYADKGAAEAVTVTLDGLANDGEGGAAEGDNAIAENVTGGAGADTLTGNGGANVMNGAGGIDTVDYQDKTLATQAVTVTLDGAANDGTALENDNVITENVTGGAGADTLTGNNGANRLSGAGNVDTVTYADKGAAEPVTVTLDGIANDGEGGGAELDNVISENVTGGAGADTLTGNAVANVLDGAANTDTVTYADKTLATQAVTVRLDGLANDGETVGAEGDNVISENVTGGAGADTLTGNTGANVMSGAGGIDTVDYLDKAGAGQAVIVSLDGAANDGTAAENDNVITENVTGGAGADTLTGNGGANRLDGAANTDTVTYADKGAAEPVTVTLDGLANDGTLAEGDNAIAENVTGGAGADTLTGNAVANRLDGAGNTDTVTYADKTLATQAVTVRLDGVANDGESVGAEGDNVISENVTGGAGDDTLTGNAGPNAMSGAGGIDTVDYLDKAGPLQAVRVTLDGLANDGETNGAEGDNVLTENVTGGAGADTLTGNGAANVLNGADNTDTVDYVDKTLATQAVTVTLDGAPNDGESGGAEGDNVIAENVTGGAGADTLTGNVVANRLDGAGNTDTVDYQDKVAVGQGVTVTLDGAANDGETAGAEGDNVIAENVTGGAGVDTITGNAGPNTLRGAGSADTINALGGADIVLGEADAGDTLDGGGDAGDLLSYVNETQVVVNLSGSPTPPAGTDTATNFTDVLGGNGDDTITGNAVANNLNGGPGADTVTYLDRAASVTVTLDGLANDGAAAGAEGDNVIAENVTGGGGADTLTGNTGPNRLDGAGAVDTVDYADKTGPLQAVTVTLDGAANDGEAGGAEGDNVIAENVTGGAGADRLTGNAVANRLDGAGNIDTVDYQDKVGAGQAVRVTLDAAANDGESGGAEGDNAIAENVTGGAGADTLTGNAGPNAMSGAGGLDTVDYADKPGPLQALTVTLDGAANDGETGGAEGDNVLTENVTGGAGGDTITGEIGPNVLDGVDGDDSLTGAGGIDTVRGGNGADTIFGGADGSNDALDGGNDGARDVLTYIGETGDVTVNLSGSAAAPAGSDTASNFEDVIGGNGNDTITGTPLGNALTGGPGVDTVTYLDRATQGVDVSLNGLADDGAPGENDNVVTTENITGGGGPDHLEGNQGDNIVLGDGGDDVVVGGGGSDQRLDGGPGFDTASYEDRGANEGITVTLNGTGGGNGESDTLFNFERLLGGDGDDVLTGSPAGDAIAGALGADTIAGGDGNDTLDGDLGNDAINGGPGSDQLNGGDGNDRLDGAADADGFSGGDGDDDINAFDGTSENVVCGAGNDRVDHDLVDTFSAGDCELRNLLGFLPPAFVLDPRSRDRDRDGVFAGTDCNDFDPSIRPGAPDTPGDAIDQNCDGIDAPFPALTTDFRWGFSKAKLGTRVKLLQLRKVPAGAKIEVRCRSTRSPRCVFKDRTRTVTKRSPIVSVRGYFGDRPLGRGAVIEVRVSAPRTIGRFISFTTRSDRNSPTPKRACLALNGVDVVACP